MIANIERAKTYTDLTALHQLKSSVNDSDPEQLRAVAQQFEAIMVQQILKNMRQTNQNFSGDLLNNQHVEFFTDMFDQQLALDISDKGLGLADVLVQQLQVSKGIMK